MKKIFQIIALVFLLVSVIPSQGSAGPLGGSFLLGEPWGMNEYDFRFYDLSNITLSGSGINIVSNDANWGFEGTDASDNDIWVVNGWPGVVLDKVFFSPASAMTGGIFTADVELTIPDIYEGYSFPAVINPDILPIQLQNTSGKFGEFYDTSNQRHDTLEFTGLKVYAIVSQYWAGQNGIIDIDSDLIIPFPEQFFPWQYANDGYLYDPNNSNSPRFYLAEVGTLNLNAIDPPFTFNLTPPSTFTPADASVPEPATMLLLGLGLVGLAGVRRTFKK